MKLEDRRSMSAGSLIVANESERCHAGIEFQRNAGDDCADLNDLDAGDR